MLRLIIALVVLAMGSGFAGYGTLAATLSWAAQLLTIVFVVLAIAAMLLNAAGGSIRTV